MAQIMISIYKQGIFTKFIRPQNRKEDTKMYAHSLYLLLD